MLIGAAVAQGASRGFSVSPVFSLYSFHGPVFRVLLRATRSAQWPARHYGFAGCVCARACERVRVCCEAARLQLPRAQRHGDGCAVLLPQRRHCHVHGDTTVVGWRDLAGAVCT